MGNIHCLLVTCSLSFEYFLFTLGQNTVSQKPKISPTSSTEYNGDKQFVVICSEKQARVSNLLFVFSCLQILGITDITEVNINLRSNVSSHCWNLFTTSINRKAENGIHSFLHSLPSSWAVVKVNEI